ncbi:hypothetical protein JZ751_019953 [Albula glossodonta]|uniref:Uncharacterized protein n=1 Tax=Albula glossodonta TaxID=121402 RepID=A0A8T2MYN2_9TELE|nr:hypothetical protein JZ751_011471 [Albula glossodonta]KAG9331161.1 hypothetical protein JZ751_019953 [Albula glossodonta]
MGNGSTAEAACVNRIASPAHASATLALCTPVLHCGLWVTNTPPVLAGLGMGKLPVLLLVFHASGDTMSRGSKAKTQENRPSLLLSGPENDRLLDLLGRRCVGHNALGRLPGDRSRASVQTQRTELSWAPGLGSTGCAALSAFMLLHPQLPAV